MKTTENLRELQYA